MIGLDLALFSSGSLMRAPLALGEDLSPVPGRQTSRASFHDVPKRLRTVRGARRELFQPKFLAAPPRRASIPGFGPTPAD